jgi:tRNA A37 threonylcarbamoyladenosine dehydratase
LKERKPLHSVREKESQSLRAVFSSPMFKDTEKTAKFPVTYFVHENTAKTIEVIFPFSHYRCIVTAFKLLLFQTILTERVKGNVRVMLADMEFK